ncbi:PAS domain-containing protein [Paenibacillus sp. Soil522]|uniref:PAS domain-containing protein n=1 Tax=Paenibacillus sp. Soil522 TaxID=1736388 RepID=UPI0006FC0886|nr:PAS domain S-box protein [Paenibacillus sp. Soil522]KRE35424.1 hypothetical protein ASG81_21055 [Paenibacillus sp. Soil522]
MEQNITRGKGNGNSFDIVQKIDNLGYWEFDHARNQAAWSNQMFRIYGLNSDFSMKQDDFFNLVHPEDRERVKRQFYIAVESKTECAQEYRIIRPNGEVRYVVEHITFKFDMGNEITLTIGTIQDVTENKNLQHRLTVEEQHYKSIFENNPDAVFSLDVNGRFLSCNSALEQMFGYSRDEIIAGHFDHFVHAECLGRTNHFFEETVRTLTPQNFDTTGITKNGQTIEVNVTNIPIIINHELIGVYGIAKDITQKNRIEQSLREAELKYRSIIEQSIVGIFVAQKNSFVYTNEQLDKMLGYESLIGIDVADALHIDEREAVVSQVMLLTEGESLPNFCHRAIKRDGTVIHCEVHYNRVSHLGETAIIGIVLDITERSKAQELNQYLAYHDYLTELPNRRLFEE